MRNFIEKTLLISSIILALIGIGLLVWCGVGQFQAQMRYDGQYITFRTMQDISLWGYLGIPSLIIAFVLFCIYLNMD